MRHPSPSLAPTEIIQNAYQRYLSSPHAHIGLGYGLDPGPPETQTAIAKWLKRAYSLKYEPHAYAAIKDLLIIRDNILITGGASAGLNVALQKVTWPGYTRRVFMVAPTYYLAAGNCGYSNRFTGIPEDDEGLNITILKSEIEKCETEQETEKPNWQKWTYRYVFYGVPTFSNPTGSVMSLERRKELVDLARKYNMLLITDDVYDLLSYTSDPIPPRLVTIDSPESSEEGFGNAVSNCSLSKLLAPGLRVGFMQGRKDLIHELSTHGVGSSGGCPSQFPACVITPIIAEGTLENRIEMLKEVYSKRAAIYSAAIDQYLLPFGAEYNPCLGGYFIWIKLPNRITSDQLFEEAQRDGIWLMAGTSCKVPDDTSVEYDKYIRIAIALEEETKAVEGIKRIGKIFERFLER